MRAVNFYLWSALCSNYGVMAHFYAEGISASDPQDQLAVMLPMN